VKHFKTMNGIAGTLCACGYGTISWLGTCRLIYRLLMRELSVRMKI